MGLLNYNQFINELKTAHVFPKHMRDINLLYHATMFASFVKIIDSDILYGSDMYDYGVATSRNKFYNFSAATGDDPDYNNADIQFILDRNKIKHNYKIQAFDYEEYKRQPNLKTGEYDLSQQSEDKIMTDAIKNLHKYLIGIQISKEHGVLYNNHNEQTVEIIPYLKEKTNFVKYIKQHNLKVYDEDWNDITSSLTAA